MKKPRVIDYFTSIWTPKHIFIKRHTLTWLGMCVIFIFLISCLLYPITWQTARLESVSLDTFAPTILDTVDEETLQALKSASVEQDTVTGKAFESDKIAGWQENRQAYLDRLDKGIYFETIGFYIKTETGNVVQVPYSKPETSSLQTVDDVKNFVSKQWFVANRSFAVLYILLTTAILIGVNTLLIVLGSAIFLYLTRKSKLFTFKTYKECVNLILNAMGIPTLLATICLFMGVAIPTSMQIQGFSTVLMLLATLYSTHYNDGYVTSKKSR